LRAFDSGPSPRVPSSFSPLRKNPPPSTVRFFCLLHHGWMDVTLFPSPPFSDRAYPSPPPPPLLQRVLFLFPPPYFPPFPPLPLPSRQKNSFSPPWRLKSGPLPFFPISFPPFFFFFLEAKFSPHVAAGAFCSLPRYGLSFFYAVFFFLNRPLKFLRYEHSFLLRSPLHLVPEPEKALRELSLPFLWARKLPFFFFPFFFFRTKAAPHGPIQSVTLSYRTPPPPVAREPTPALPEKGPPFFFPSPFFFAPSPLIALLFYAAQSLPFFSCSKTTFLARSHQFFKEHSSLPFFFF